MAGTPIGEGFQLRALGQRSFEAGDLMVELVEVSFSGTATTVEVTTNLSEVLFMSAMPKTVTYNANDQLSSDLVVTSGAVTLSRSSAGTSGLTCVVLLIGRRWD